MLPRVTAAWHWFVGGLAEALLWAIERARPAPRLRIDLGGDGPVLDGGGRRLGRLAPGDAAAFEPADLARRLRGADVDLVVPANWLARRELDPVAVASRPFLDAYVRHQIERVTPWRVGDTHYRIVERALPDDPGRLAIAVAVVPRRLVAGTLAALGPLGARALRLRADDDPDGAAAVPLRAGSGDREARLRRGIAWGLAGAGLAAAGLVAVLQWQAAAVGDDIVDQDRVLEERRAVLARERRASDPDGAAGGRLRAIADARAPTLAVIDALSAALPDDAHLTALSIEGDRVTVAGVSSDPAALVPALETSGAFAEVAFGAATARAQAGGDTFSLEMRAVPPRSDHAHPPPPPPPATAAAKAVP